MKMLGRLLLLFVLAMPCRAATHVGSEVHGVAAANLQATITAMTGGGIVHLGPGTYTGDITISNQGIVLEGESVDATVLTGSILVETGNVTIRNMTVRGAGEAYGIKLFKSGAGVPRCTLRNLWIGASDTVSRNAAGGPVKGLYLDGAIVTSVDHCTFAFCSGSGVYMNSSGLPNYSTNANVFRDCTFNLNSRYGVELAGSGMEGNQFIGGNMEDNTFGAAQVVSTNITIFKGVDFESTVFPIASLLDLQGSSPITLEDCNFNCSNLTRAFFFQSCTNAKVHGCFFAGITVGTAVGLFDANCARATEWENVVATGCFIENRGPKNDPNLGRMFQNNLGQFTGVLWLPSAAGTGDQSLGPIWTKTGTLAQPTPTVSRLSGWLKRTTFASSGASQEIGVKQTANSDCAFWVGDSLSYGGFYFAATFRLDTYGGSAGATNSTRLFVGLASNAAGAVCLLDSANVIGDAIGLYRDSNDLVNVVRVLCRKGSGTTAKRALTSTNGGPIIDSGQGFLFEMFCPPNSNRVNCVLTSLNTGLIVGQVTCTNDMTTTAFMAPQVEVGNGTSGACTLGISNVYAAPAR